MPVPRSENVSLTPRLLMLVVAPWPPIDSEPPFLLRLIQMPLTRRMRLRNRKPIKSVVSSWPISYELSAARAKSAGLVSSSYAICRIRYA
jgi:hypothetical protein